MTFKVLGSTLLTAMGLMACASTASATTLELGGVKQAGAVTIGWSVKAGGSIEWVDTGAFFVNQCTSSTLQATTSTVTGTTVGGPVSSLTFTSCATEPVTVDTKGSLSVENIAGTTNGTVRLIGAKVTVPSPFGLLTCVTAASPGTDIGTLTGVASTASHATMDLNAALNCGSITARLRGSLVFTIGAGLGVTS
jgi:hypothetical protein